MKKTFKTEEENTLYDYLLGYRHAQYHITFLPRPKRDFTGKSKSYISGYLDLWSTHMKLNC